MTETNFYRAVRVPFNGEDQEFEFVNQVVVAEHFIRLQDLVAEINERSLDLTNELRNLEVHLKRRTRDLAKVRRTLMARNYSRLTKTADKDVQEAFILMVAEENPTFLAQMNEIESDIEDLTQKIESRKPLIEEFKDKQKLVEKIAEYAKQYLDFRKLEIRIENNIK